MEREGQTVVTLTCPKDSKILAAAAAVVLPALAAALNIPGSCYSSALSKSTPKAGTWLACPYLLLLL